MYLHINRTTLINGIGIDRCKRKSVASLEKAYTLNIIHII